jgi:hypothetical protein
MEMEARGGAESDFRAGAWVGMGVVGVLHLRPHTVFLDCTVLRTEYLRNNKLAITPYAGQA